MQKKRALIKMVFDKARKEVPNTSTSSLAAYLSALFQEKFEFAKGEKTFSRYHKKLIDENTDYNIDAITLDQLSSYIGFENFSSFCENFKDEKVQQYGAVRITVSDETAENNVSGVVINITNSPLFNIPEFFTQNKNSFAFLALIMVLGFFVNRSGYFEKDREHIVLEVWNQAVPVTEKNDSTVQKLRIYIIEKPETDTAVEIVTTKKKKRMYWTDDHHEAVLMIK
ncbi:hypothetical protein [Chryseobacterium sp.]|uniref:hypothetical protein n=1 Tax=Chryseobacterium sp. TaxID=1871047 RepID=UPI0011C7D0B2|nr:hypothetical protein [Chryseobacterium sp.]TXF79000.1 hypothetical protein FUA25_00995 [Chryseobacterium sp.]